MNILIGFQKHDKEIDDVYLLPTLAISNYHSIKGKGYAIGIKFLKAIFMILIIIRPIAQQPHGGQSVSQPAPNPQERTSPC